MEKKKTKLTISGNKKKPIDNIELAKLQNKNSVVIEQKTSRFGSKTSFKRSFGVHKTNQNIGFKSNTFSTKKPQNSSFSAGAPKKINDYKYVIEDTVSIIGQFGIAINTFDKIGIVFFFSIIP